MAYDVLMAKSKLPPGTIDLGIGEPHILREALLRKYGIDSISHNEYPHIWEYAPPNGYDKLVQLLEEKYQARVVVTVGAKQGLLASFSALAANGLQTISFRAPYWPSIPYLVNRAGMISACYNDKHHVSGIQSCLVVAPNNPDGYNLPYDGLKNLFDGLKEQGIPSIHDAAYYTRSYLGEDYCSSPLGDMQIFSVSKMYGLSGLRLGWVVCHDESYYDSLASYVESTTSGVSTASQRIMIELIELEKQNPDLLRDFEDEVFQSLRDAKRLLLETINPDVLEVPTDLIYTPGIFAWCKPRKTWDYNSVGVNVIDGEPFGAPGMVRLSLGVPLDDLRQAISRLNTLCL